MNSLLNPSMLRPGVRLVALFAGLALILAGAGTSLAGPTKTARETVPAEGVENIEVEIDFAAGELVINSADQDEAAKLEIVYSEDWVGYDVDYHTRGKTGRLVLESDLRGHRHNHDDLENEWTLTLSTKYNTIIDIDMGACDADLDLGGLRIEEMHMDVGATSGHIDFSEPNPITLEDMDVDVGASSLEMKHLGNAHIERMSFSCGAASCELDFSGDFRGETVLDLDVGVGSADVMVPEDVGVRVIGEDGWFSSLDFHGLKLRRVDDDVRETEDFDDAEKRLVIRVDVGMGSVDIYGNR